MIDLVLGQIVADAAPVCEDASFIELGVDPHFFEQPPLCCNYRVFTGSRMTAACICPQSAAVILVISSPLQENSAAVILYEDREGAMKRAVAMRVELRRGTDRLISLVYKNYRFLMHALVT